MDGKGAWRDNVFVERLWRSVKYEEVYLRAYESVGEARLDRPILRLSTMAADRIRALTTPHRIKPTSTSRQSAWRPNPGRRSTYRRGDPVQIMTCH
jgi:putative transposase